MLQSTEKSLTLAKNQTSTVQSIVAILTELSRLKKTDMVEKILVLIFVFRLHPLELEKIFLAYAY
jgi:hypothetical protein